MKQPGSIRLVCAGVALATAALCGPTQAAEVDLITGSSGSANGTLYLRDDAQPTGTGVFQPFLRVQGNGNEATEEGYNANFGPKSEVPFDEKVGTWTHSLLFSDLHKTTIDGFEYFEFLLDLDEPNSEDKWPISLDSVLIWNTGADELVEPFTDDLTDFGTPLYDMDVGADGDSSVMMDGSRTHGNGQSDMAMYILADLFDGVDANDHITFYSLFGILSPPTFQVDGSFEEWAVREGTDTTVPVPGTLGLLGLGLLAMGTMRRRD